MKKFVLCVAVAALGLLVPQVAVHAADDSMPTAGQKAPTFTLPSQTGKSVSLKSYHGKWVVLYFYPKDMTQGCTIEAHQFAEKSALPDPQASVQLIPCAYCITVSSGVMRSASSSTASLKAAFSTSSRGCAELLAKVPN